MATRGSMGGMGTTTGETADVMDAFGFDRILIETVGVGQSELDVAAAADTTLVVLVPESGDGIQVMKAGLMEIADIFVVNKSDRPGADKIRQELEVAIGLRAGQAFRHIKSHHGATISRTDAPARRRTEEAPVWEPPVLPTIASQGDGVPELVATLDKHFAFWTESGRLVERRAMRMQLRTREVVERAVRRWIWSDGQKDEMDAVMKDVAAGTRSPYEAAASLVARLQGSVAYERS
jgi:LAO/AO transport system kinase